MIEIDGTFITHDPAITQREITDIYAAELATYKAAGKMLGTIGLTLDGDEIVIRSKSREKINRVRRITGYCADLDQFNAAKLAELRDRKVNM